MISLKRISRGQSLALLLLCVVESRHVHAADTKATAPVSTPAPVPAGVTLSAPAVAPFETFRSIAERNIFDPNRVGRSRTNRSEVARPTDDVISLVGTMDSEKGLVAFFDSAVPQFKKVARVGEPIADYTVAKITPQEVELTRDSKITPLQVAQQLRRPVGGDWTVTATPPVPSEAPSATPSSSAAPTTTDNAAAGAPAVPADASDLVKRLMERRQNQLKE